MAAISPGQITGILSAGYVSGNYYPVPARCHNYITQGLSGNSIYYTPVEIGTRVGITTISCKINSAATGATLRMGIYDNAGGKPGNLILDAGSVAVSTTGVKEVTLASTLYLLPGWYWFAIFSSGAPTLDSANGALLNGVIGFTTAGNTGQVTGLRATLTYSTFPSTANLTSLLYISSAPLLWFKAA